MSKRNNKLLIDDILTSIEKIKAYTSGLDFDSFLSDTKTVEAVERNFEIIGEAANQLTQDFREIHVEIPWYAVISFRNRLIHDYFGVDYQILWYILQNDLPFLENKLRQIICS